MANPDVDEFEAARARTEALRQAGYAVTARYDRHSARVVVGLSTGIRISVAAWRIEGLAGAAPDALADIEISPAGLGLHWPQLDADVYLPALLHGVFGSERWMAELPDAVGGGKARSPAKAANGRKGGRPRRPVQS